MTTAKAPAKKSAAKKSATKHAVKKAPAKKAPAKKSAAEGNHCWPGFKPTPGKTAGTKGSCEPIPGEHSKTTKKKTQKAAAASKLEKQGKPNPKG